MSFSNSGAVKTAEVITPMSPRLSSCFGVQIPVETWHTVLPFEETILLEIKEGPFIPAKAKEYPTWAPPEGSDEASAYFSSLKSHYSDLDHY
jgi:cupin fold WbuC family metalloprotein